MTCFFIPEVILEYWYIVTSFGYHLDPRANTDTTYAIIRFKSNANFCLGVYTMLKTDAQV